MAKPLGDVEAKSQGDGEGKLWNMDRPLGFEAERISSMRYQKVSSHESVDVLCVHFL
jgi:hypothetical protein